MSKISVLLPTRLRNGVLRKSVDSLVGTCLSKDNVEILLRYDSDDTWSFEQFEGDCCKKFIGERFGYSGFHKYINELCGHAQGDWLFLWNDDAIMRSARWDEAISQFDGRFLVLSPRTNHSTQTWEAIFPIIPKKWVEVTGYWAPNAHCDTWVSQVALALKVFQVVPHIDILHDRFDMTGRNDDQIYRERVYTTKEYLEMGSVRERDCEVLREYLRGVPTG